MRLNFYSRRRRFNKSLLGSHKNTLTLTKKRYASKTITHSQPPAINTDKFFYAVANYRLLEFQSSRFLDKLARLAYLAEIAEIVYIAEIEEIEELDKLDKIDEREEKGLRGWRAGGLEF